MSYFLCLRLLLPFICLLAVVLTHSLPFCPLYYFFFTSIIVMNTVCSVQIMIMRISKQSQNRIKCHYVETMMLISPRSLFLSTAPPPSRFNRRVSGEMFECVRSLACVCVCFFDVTSLKCNSHWGWHCIHHCTSGSPAACMCIIVRGGWGVMHVRSCWGPVVDLLIPVCLCRWCQTLLRQCFGNECICVCHACKTQY